MNSWPYDEMASCRLYLKRGWSRSNLLVVSHEMRQSKANSKLVLILSASSEVRRRLKSGKFGRRGIKSLGQDRLDMRTD